MSTLKNAIKKAEKLSDQKIQISDNHLHFVIYKSYVISFYPNGMMSEDVNATNFYTRREDKQDDTQTDYFAGTFHDNLTQAFKFVERADESTKAQAKLFAK